MSKSSCYLTPQEKEVLVLTVVHGLTARAAGRLLRVTPRTVHRRTADVRKRFEAASLQQMAYRITKAGLLDGFE